MILPDCPSAVLATWKTAVVSRHTGSVIGETTIKYISLYRRMILIYSETCYYQRLYKKNIFYFPQEIQHVMNLYKEIYIVYCDPY